MLRGLGHRPHSWCVAKWTLSWSAPLAALTSTGLTNKELVVSWQHVRVAAGQNLILFCYV